MPGSPNAPDRHELVRDLRAIGYRKAGGAVRRLRRRLVRMQLTQRLRPISEQYGYDRGTPIDRYYIEHFLGRLTDRPAYSIGTIRGRVLEIGGREYADRFGSTSAGPLTIDVLHENAASGTASIVGSLTDDVLPADAFDCILCTQTLHVIYDVRAAIRTLHRGLRPGGTLLATMPGISRSCVPDRDHWGDWWRFTSLSAQRLLEEAFSPGQVRVEAYGNVLTATAFLYGLAAEELRRDELDVRDPDYEVIIAARAVKDSAG
jgi:SAM-dependent methyltransferase